MNQKLKWGAALILAMATVATPAIARDDRGDRGRHGYNHRDNDRHDRRHERRHDRRDTRQSDRHDRRDARRDHRYDRRHDRRDHYAYSRSHRPPVRVVHHRPVVRHVYHPPRHAGPPPWARGGYVHHYNRPIYVVRNYRGHGLRHPPRGYHWVRDDVGDFLMVAVATGIIADVILRR